MDPSVTVVNQLCQGPKSQGNSVSWLFAAIYWKTIIVLPASAPTKFESHLESCDAQLCNLNFGPWSRKYKRKTNLVTGIPKVTVYIKRRSSFRYLLVLGGGDSHKKRKEAQCLPRVRWAARTQEAFCKWVLFCATGKPTVMTSVTRWSDASSVHGRGGQARAPIRSIQC